MHGRKLLLVLTAAGLTLVVGTRFSGPGGRDARGTPGEREGASGRAIQRRGDVRRATDDVAGRDAVTSDAAASLPRRVVVAPRARPAADRQVIYPVGTPRREGDLATIARQVLAENRSHLGLDDIPGELRLAREATTFSGHHLRLRQTVQGVVAGAPVAIPVEGSEVAVHIAPDGRPLLVQADVFAAEGTAVSPVVSAAAAADAARELLVDPDDDAAVFEHRPPELWVRPEGRTGRLVWRIDARTGDESARVVVDATDGEVVATRDLRVGADGQAKVFQPNPVFSSHDTSLRDRSDRTSAGLAAALQLVTLRRLDGSGRVRGQWCDAARGRGDAVNAPLDWTALTRDDDTFELVNAYFHVDATQERLRALGITSANASAQRVDAHALTADQSYYDVYDDTVRFGDGGVDDGEDGDIVIHEYGHAIQEDQAPDFGATAEGGAMGEGFSDFLAASMHATGDADWDPLVGSWDATAYTNANPPYLRRVDVSKVYPRDIVDEPHDDGELWSRFLWDVRALIGGDDALRVAIAAHEYLNSNAKFLQGANAVLIANLALREGRDDAGIRALLRARGLPFNYPPLDAPSEDAYEENDDAAHGAQVVTGAYGPLLLADDDWFQVSVGPYRRLQARATFVSADMDLDLETRSTSGDLIEGSYGSAGQEIASATAGLDGGSFLVRAFRGDGSVGVAAYDLALLDLDLESLKPGRTNVRRTSGAAEDAVTLTVGPEKVGSGAKLVVTSVSRPGGAKNDVRVVSPSGTMVADFGAGATARGARIVLPASESGAWRIEVRARPGTSGKYTLQAKFRK